MVGGGAGMMTFVDCKQRLCSSCYNEVSVNMGPGAGMTILLLIANEENSAFYDRTVVVCPGWKKKRVF